VYKLKKVTESSVNLRKDSFFYLRAAKSARFLNTEAAKKHTNFSHLKSQQMNDPALSHKEVAQQLGLCTRTVLKRIHSG